MRVAEKKEDLGAEVRITGGSRRGTVYVGPGLTPFSTVGIMAIHYSFHIIFSLRVTHPKLDLPPAPGITFPSPRAALSLSLRIRRLLFVFVQSSLRNHSVPTSCSVRPAHGRPLSQSVPNKFISTSVQLSPPSSGLPASTAIPSLLPHRRIPSPPPRLFPFLPG